jgi:uncharacterized protein (DUF362 family)/ferredoxin
MKIREKKFRVAVVKCPDYGQAGAKLKKLLDLMDLGKDFFRAGEKIALKVNLLQASEPEKAVTTHPAVVSALGKLIEPTGARVLIADSPGAGLPYRSRTMERVYHKTGMTGAAEEAGIELNRDFSHRIVSFPRGKLIQRFEVITPVLEADGIINLCKLKTHSFMSMTGAVKNCFGVIPGYTKPGYHAKLKDADYFADMLLDLFQYVSPRLSIMDAVYSMMGEGPHAGDPVLTGYLLGSTSPLALDVVAAEIMGLPKNKNPLLMVAEKRGMAPTRIDQINLIGIRPEQLAFAGFKLPSTLEAASGLDRIPAPVRKAIEALFKHASSLKPVVSKDKCTGCGTCRDACPQGVIELIDRKAEIHHGDCIRCYCCHEMCPEKAIELKAHWLHRLFKYFSI